MRPIPSYTVMVGAAKRKPAISIVPFEENVKPPVLVEEVAQSAMKLETLRRISIIGDATGATIFDGSDDATLKITVKTSERALKDGNGKEISKTYARKTDLDEYATKENVNNRLNLIEKVLYATKDAANNSLRESNLNYATADDIENLF